MTRACRLFVYGTLRSGQPAHDKMGDAHFVGRCRTTAAWRMLDLGDYPAIVPGDDVVDGELYEVDEATLEALDQYEGPSFSRVPVLLEDGSTAQTYRGRTSPT